MHEPQQPLEPEEIRRWLERHLARSEPNHWAVVEHLSGLVVGYCGGSWQSFENQMHWEMNYWTGETFRGRGYATDAVRLLCEQCFGAGISEVALFIDPANGASLRVAQKNGCAMVREVHHRGGDALWMRKTV